MPNKMLLFGITVLAAVIIIGGASWTLFNNYNQSPTTQNPENNGPSPEPENQNPEASPSDTTSESPNNTITNSSPGTNDTLNPSSLPVISPQEKVRDAAMASVKTKYSETAQIMTNLNWTGGRTESFTPENETYLFYSPGWSVKVEYPATSELVYTVTGNYNSPTLFVTFTAVEKNGVINITNYSSQRLTPPQP